MPDKSNDSLGEDLNQMRQDFEKGLAHLEEIKQNADPDLLKNLEEIERKGWRLVIEIGEIQKNQNITSVAQIERNTILYRMNNSSPAREKIGNICI